MLWSRGGWPRAQVSEPLRSVYRWQGRTVHAREWKCAIKTMKSAYKGVEAVIRGLHNHSLPQITVVEIAGGSRDYLTWLMDEIAT